MTVVMTKRLFAGVLLSSLVLCAHAQGTGPLAIEDRSTARSMASAATDQGSAPASAASEDALIMLMQQQQQFEEQVQMLQGQIEELRHELQVMKDAERERYLDLDTRINTLAEQGVAEQSESGDAAGPADPEADKQAYNAAKDHLVGRDFDAAATAFEGYLKDFPNGQYRAHAHFWLGQVYSNQKTPQNDKAMEQFQAVVDNYPDHSKAPSSLYTLAVMQARSGKVSEAKINLHKLIKQYPDSTKVSQAKTLLDQLNS